jgi:hypothetical protein
MFSKGGNRVRDMSLDRARTSLALWVFIMALTLGDLGRNAEMSSQTPSAGRPRNELGIHGTAFTVNGRAVFLYGISYYGALGASNKMVLRDLEDMQRSGFNWLRVWATWAGFATNVAAVDTTGAPREPFLSRLAELVAECDRRGLVVDVTFSRGSGGPTAAGLATSAAHRRAVETVVLRLKGWQNWYLDLANERDVRDQRYVSVEELKTLRARVRELDPARLVTASHGGDLTREQVVQDVTTVGVDFLTPHRPRTRTSATDTAAKTAEYLAWGREAGRAVPVHYQEPFRRGYSDWEPTAGDFVNDLRAARNGGAAGWCFHNGSTRAAPGSHPRRSFDLSDGRLFEQLDAEEKKALELLGRQIGTWRSP